VEDLRARLTAARAHLLDHFRFEEQNGYLDTVKKREPRLDRAIQHLVQEHRELTGRLDALIDEAAGASNVSESMRQAVPQWLTRLASHEQRENELVQDAFDFDIGAED
jgi:hypothetical protein